MLSSVLYLISNLPALLELDSSERVDLAQLDEVVDWEPCSHLQCKSRFEETAVTKCKAFHSKRVPTVLNKVAQCVILSMVDAVTITFLELGALLTRRLAFEVLMRALPLLLSKDRWLRQEPLDHKQTRLASQDRVNVL